MRRELQIARKVESGEIPRRLGETASEAVQRALAADGLKRSEVLAADKVEDLTEEESIAQVRAARIRAHALAIPTKPNPILAEGRKRQQAICKFQKRMMNEELAVLEEIGRGERAIEEGRVASSNNARKRMSRWLK